MDRGTPLIRVDKTLRIGASVRKDLWNKFKATVKRQYGQTNWFLSYEVNEALDVYLRIKNGDLLVFDRVYVEENFDYAHTQEQRIRSVDSLVEEKFKVRFGGVSQIHARRLKKFVLEDCGFQSRTKYYDVRDELLAKGYISPHLDRKQVFNVESMPGIDYDALNEVDE